MKKLLILALFIVTITFELVTEARHHDKHHSDPSPCWNCNGSGMCPTCNGTGLMKEETFIDDELVEIETECTDCYGNGQCQTCFGAGTM